MMRRMRLLLIAALTIAVALSAIGCSASSGDSGDTADSSQAQGDTSGDVASTPTTDEDLAAALEAEYGTAEWYPSVQWIGFDQVLLARVIRVETDLEMSDYELAGEIASAVASVLHTDEAANIQVISGDGFGSVGQSWGSEMGEVYDLPPAPTSAEELKSWIDTVYGESGEDWYAYVKSFAVSDSEPGWAGTTVVVIETDLPDRSDESLALGDRIAEAVTSTGQTISDSYVMKMASGEQLRSGDLPVLSLSY